MGLPVLSTAANRRLSSAVLLALMIGGCSVAPQPTSTPLTWVAIGSVDPEAQQVVVTTNSQTCGAHAQVNSISYSETTIEIALVEIPPDPDTLSPCPVVPLTIQLREPVGDRALVDANQR